MNERGRRKTARGVVVGNKMNKSIVVQEEVLVKHRRYGKYVRRRVKHMAHDEENVAKLGDMVEIMETRPLSRRKCWRLVRVVASAGAEDTARAEQ